MKGWIKRPWDFLMPFFIINLFDLSHCFDYEVEIICSLRFVWSNIYLYHRSSFKSFSQTERLSTKSTIISKLVKIRWIHQLMINKYNYLSFFIQICIYRFQNEFWIIANLNVTQLMLTMFCRKLFSIKSNRCLGITIWFVWHNYSIS